jgi:hypothetical protein
MKHIYGSKTGMPRELYTANQIALTTDKIHVILEFQCDKAYWGIGLAQIAMASYERAMLKLPQAADLQTSILSPAPLVDVLATVDHPHSTQEIEQRLVNSYAKSGYVVWSAPLKPIDAGFIVMGKALGTPIATRPAVAVTGGTARRTRIRAARVRRVEAKVMVEEAGPNRCKRHHAEATVLRRSRGRNLIVHTNDAGRKCATWRDSVFRVVPAPQVAPQAVVVFETTSTT